MAEIEMTLGWVIAYVDDQQRRPRSTSAPSDPATSRARAGRRASLPLLAGAVAHADLEMAAAFAAMTSTAPRRATARQ
jgi:hypothetical protein